MIIRCPHCEFSRSIGEHSIPKGAEFVTCPKCKHRFKFRTIERAEEFATSLAQPTTQLSAKPTNQPSEHTDIWDAVDALHQRFERQLETQVTEVVTEQISPPSETPDHSDEKTDDHLEKSLPQLHASKQNEALPKEQPVKNNTPFSGLSNLLHSLPFFAFLASKEKTFPEQKNLLQVDDPTEDQKESIGAEQEFSDPRQSQEPEDDHAEEREKDVTAKDSSSCDKKEDEIPKKKSPSSTVGSSQSLKILPKTTMLVDESGTSCTNADNAFPVSKEQNSDCSAEKTSSFTPQPFTAPISPEDTLDKPTDAPFEEDTTKFKPIFPFSYEDTTPEQRVEEGLKYLNADQDRPLRDLGKIEDVQTDEEKELHFGAPIGDVKWESPAQHGWWKSFVHTVMSVMFSAPSFFLKLPSSSGLSLAFTFFLIQSYFAILFSLLWGYITGLLLDIPLFQATIPNLPFMLLFAPIALGLIAILSTELLRLALILFGTRNVPFPLVLRITCYSTAPMVLSIIPFIGPFVGTLWFFLSMVIAGKKIFSYSWISAILFTLPATLSIIGGVLLFFL